MDEAVIYVPDACRFKVQDRRGCRFHPLGEDSAGKGGGGALLPLNARDRGAKIRIPQDG